MSKNLKKKILKLFKKDFNCSVKEYPEIIADQILELFSLQKQEIVKEIQEIKEIAFESSDSVYDSLVSLLEKLN